jgi:hypothetical protein
MQVLNFRAAGVVMIATRLFLSPHVVWAQQAPIAYVSTTGVSVSGSLSVENGRAIIGNNGTITAGDSTAMVKLSRGGDMEVCASTKVHLSRDTSVTGGDDSALMIALDRGALEANYVPGKYSDVLLTPDLRILISGPGTADLKVRVNEKGDTCVDNHGAGAPYVTVTSNFAGGVYRVQANQRVMFEQGSLDQVVDNEAESCGCPAAAPVVVASKATISEQAAAAVNANAASGTTNATAPTKAVAEAANPFPLAQSEGLATAPAAPVKPVVPVGQVHAEVEAPITYDAAKTPDPAAQGAAGPAPVVCHSTASPGCPNLAINDPGIGPTEQTVGAKVAAVQAVQTPQRKHGGFFHSIGRFFSKVFGQG